MISEASVKAFLKGFKPDYQTHLIDFCNTISETHADVYFLMARKATCFFSCLEELGLIHFDGYVTSERVLDMDLQWLANKEVIIIDDAIVSGTTLYRTIEKLNGAGVKSVKVYVLTINRQWYQPDMLNSEDGTSYLVDCFDSVEDVECINLCYKVVEAILCYPRPYDIDFPLYKRKVFKPQYLDRIFNHSGWSSYEVTTLNQEKNGTRSFTIIPSAETQKRFLSQYRCEFIGESLLKIRVYIAFKNKNKRTYEARFLPVVVLDELPESIVNDIFEDLVANNELFLKAFSSTTSRLRFLQFFYSHRFMEFWCNDAVRGDFYTVNDLILTENNLTFIFPDTVDSEIKEFCYSDAIQSTLFKDEKPHLDFSNASDCECDPIDAEDFLISQFIDIYYKKEIPCRIKVKDLGREVFESSDYKQLVQRLSSGFTYRNLVNKLSSYANGIDALTRVSIFLDRAIDYGMVVPITQIENGIVSRAYRHGEDILFGEREEKLFAIMLRSFQVAARGEYPITHLSAEKMMVLFTKIGVSLGVLDLYVSNFTCTPLNRDKQKCDVLRIKPYLKGNVAMAGSVDVLHKGYKIPFATESDKALWLSDLFLKKKHYLSRIPVGQYRLYNVVESVPDSAIDQNSKDMSKRIGRLFGKVCNPNEDTGITFKDSDLVCLSTCCSIKDTVLAITSELNIFKEDWSDTAELLRLKEESFRTKDMYEAVNSAHMKGRYFDEGKAWELVDQVKFKNETEQEEWNKFFYELRYKDVVKGEKERIYRAYNAGKYLSLQLLYLVTLMDLAILVRDTRGKKKSRYDELWSRILSYHDEIDEYHKSSKPGNFFIDNSKIEAEYQRFKTAFDSGERMWDSSNIFQCITHIYEHIDQVVLPECKTYIELIEVMLGQSGKIHELVPFKHVLCIAYSYCSDEEKEKYKSIIRTEENNMLSSIVKGESEYKITGLSELSDSDAPGIGIDLNQTELMWYVCQDDSDGDFALLASRVLYKLHLAGCTRYRMVYIGDLPFKNSIICRKETGTSLSCYGFYRFVDLLDKDLFTVNDQNARTITMLVDSESNSFNQFLRRFDEKRAQKFYSVSAVGDKIIGKITFAESRVEVIKEILDVQTASFSSGLESDAKNSSVTKKCDVGIITVTPEEARTVVDLMDLKNRISFGQRLFFEGSVKERKVVMTQSLDKGNTTIVSTFDDLVNSYHPKFVFLLGVTGMKADSVDCCDVVVATSVYAYDFSRETIDGIQPRIIGLQSSPETKPIIQALKVFGNGIRASKESPSTTFQIRTGPIASGSCTIETLKSKKREMLSKVTDEILAIETEGYGFYVAFNENKLSGNKVSGVFIVKGISNDEDDSDHQYRKPAAENAVAVAETIIELIPSDAF